MIVATIDNFTNYNTIKVGRGNQSFTFENSGFIKHFTNYGTTEKMFWGGRVGNVTNYGTMGGIVKSDSDSTLTLNNKGIMRHTNNSWGSETNMHLQLSNGAKILLENYQIKVDTKAMDFNKFSGYGDNNSHLVISGSGVSFKDGDSKLILDFGDGFELGKKYLISKLATDTSGNPYKDLGVDFSRLVSKNDIYVLSQSRQYFIAKLAPQHSAIGNLYKANIRTMNNFYTISNSMIYPRKHYKSQNLGRKNSSLRADSQNLRGNPPIKESLDSAFSLKSYESFAYQNESQNPQTRRIKRTNKRNYSRNVKNSSLRADSQNLRGNPKDLRTKRSNHLQNQRNSQNLAQNPHDYYFILTPFVNHNLFFESGRYNLSGFDYGFLTAFSARVAESNSLGTHFMMSYGSLSDSNDKNFHISNLNLNLGLNYKLDLVYDMFLKARGDVFYFLNQVKTLTMMEAIKPNNLGFGVSVSYGKDFDFKQGGILGIEVGLDYKALKSNKVSIDSQEYQKALYNLIYADVGLNYAKYFGGFGINLGGGFKANLAPNLAKSILLINSQNLDFVLDNDKYLGYANLALSYVLNHRNFDMEFSLAYYGNYGDRVISNGGGVEWRVVF